MRKLAIGAALSGALALAGVAAPAASAATSTPDLKFTGVTVNNGKAIVVGTTKTVSVPVTYTLNPAGGREHRRRHGVRRGDPVPRHPEVAAEHGRPRRPAHLHDDGGRRTRPSPRAAPRRSSSTPTMDLFEAADATTWKAGGLYSHSDTTSSDDFLSINAGTAIWGNLGTAKVQRAAKLTADASPEPVAKGRTITVKGKLTRADWNAAAYKGYSEQKVVLQFRAASSTTYTDVKAITSGTGGALSTTVKASKSGYYRYVFAGTTTTAATKGRGATTSR